MTKGKLYLWIEMNKQVMNNPHIIHETLNRDTVRHIEETLDEAKKEFPVRGQITLEGNNIDFDNVDVKGLFSVQEWFKKWFGCDTPAST